MKKVFFLFTLFLLGIFFTSAVFYAPSGLSLKYNPSKHTLTLSAEKATISNVITELSKYDFELFIVNLDKDFPVSGKFNERPVDEVLEKIIPANYRYYYRVDEKGSAAMLSQKSTQPLSSLVQKGNKVAAKSKGLPTLEKADALVSKVKFSPAPRTSTGLLNKDAALGTKIPKFKSTASMGSAKSIQPANVKETAEERGEIPARATRSGDEHIVVVFKVTESGMEAVSRTTEKGAYLATNQTLSGDMLISGSDGDNVVFLQGLENPLEARSIFDPVKSPKGHGSFKQEIGYVSVKMPKKYADAAASRKLKVQLAEIDNSKSVEVLQKFHKKQLRASDLTNKVKVINSAKALDLSKIKLNRQ